MTDDSNIRRSASISDTAGSVSNGKKLTGKRRLPPRVGGFLLASVIAVAVMLSPAARRISSGIDFGEGYGLARLTPESLSAAFSRTIQLPRVASASSLSQMLTAAGYHLERVRAGDADVPSLELLALPSDLKDLDSQDTRKAVFLKAMLPLVLQVNEEIAANRARVLDLCDRQAAGQPLSVGEQAWLADVYANYSVAVGNSAELLRRLDVVPVSLALGQAALESGWGTSRFAQEGNALFGQTGQQISSKGVALKSAADGTSFRSFDSLADAVRAYVRNLNTHVAYKEFRLARASLRRTTGEGHALNGLQLVGALKLYSERGASYLDDLRGLMRINKLQQFDKSRLTGGITADSGVNPNRTPNA
jgi:Bax protein